jgi:hypothetical protein
MTNSILLAYLSVSNRCIAAPLREKTKNLRASSSLREKTKNRCVKKKQ